MIFRGFSGIFGESPKIPEGTGRGRGQPYGQEFLGENPQKSPRGWGGEGGQSRARGFLGENPRKTPKFGDRVGARLSKSFGETLGKGTITILGILGGEIPENLRILGWGQR